MLVSGLINDASSDILMMLGRIATSGVDKLARETGLTAAQREVEKGWVQISLSSHFCLKDHLKGLTVGRLAATGLKKGYIFAAAATDDDDNDHDDHDKDDDNDDNDDHDDHDDHDDDED